MVNISVDVTDLGGEARPGDKVVFWRPRMGGSATHAGRVISTAPVTVFLTDGKATVSDVEPGEMTVLLQCRGVESQGPVTVGVPDGGHTVTLRALLESQFEYAPPIVSAVQEAASNASASEEAAIQAQMRSEAAADRADAKVDDAINNGANLIRAEVKQDADRAVSARQAAVQAESNAADSESAAASSASNAATSETNAKQSETNAGDFAAVATTAATEAVDAMDSVSDIIGAKYATQEYVDSKTWVKKPIVRDTDLNDILESGLYPVPTYTVANSLINKPPLEAIQAASLTVKAVRDGAVKQRWEKTSLVGQTQTEAVRHRDVTGAWSEWSLIGVEEQEPDKGDPEAPVKIDMLRQFSRLRRGGKVGTAGKTPVSLSFDHGFVNFRDKVLPHLIRLGLPCTVATNPNTLNVAGESEGVTFADLQSWSLNHGIEIAHHSRSHLDAPTLDTAGFEQAILSTIPEFKANMPEVIADAYIMPGVSGTGYDGFGAGLPPENWYTHPAGRMILSNFPVVTAAMLGQATPALGVPTQTIDRAGVDITSWAKATEDKISSLAGTHLGMAVFNHPSKIDNGITSERFVQFLEFLAAERDAGRIEVLTVSGFAYADVTSNVRANLAPSWEGNQAIITLPPMLEYIAGAQVLVETTATTSGDLTMTATSDVGGLNAIVTHTAAAGQKYRLVFSIPKSAKTITITAPGTNRSARIV